ncbi:phage integrase N-terminal SAM-like domain-containing protein [Leptolyngbya sp. FACHB-541]|uniref:phage integrase N-terminal SAM-like domain-containing protein n=1 Tax=Leptolyngbya sp. FACHB-541 TaxID=2692810 RepID=UPI001687ADE5|nr:phage integrase N-terminal SAM-like domain-containing protein [Leptolyngbya sp. FACHB-541]MBD1995151.1 phage integrase N-terminal SAM-like domain-containing protein [Leptolyngbya sp. FACHB-541]
MPANYLKHFSLKTKESYVNYIRNFILFHHKRHLKEMRTDEIQAYLGLARRFEYFRGLTSSSSH